jgi:hypothetical protein
MSRNLRRLHAIHGNGAIATEQVGPMNENMSMELSAPIKGHFDWSSSFSPAPVNGHVHLFW